MGNSMIAPTTRKNYVVKQEMYVLAISGAYLLLYPGETLKFLEYNSARGLYTFYDPKTTIFFWLTPDQCQLLES